MKNSNILIFLLIAFFGSIAISKAQESSDFESEINALVSKMTLEQKIGQTAMRGTSSRVKGPPPEALKEAVRKGEIGALLNVMNMDYVEQLQKIAVEESPLGIPLIFSRDVIHGFRTIFPIPLGLAASWDTEVAKSAARVSAFEASALGVRLTFAPMVDIAIDSRWGRIAESPGEDPYLASLMSGAFVEGFQGGDLSDPTTMAACLKHLIGYGAAIGGRDYNTVILDEATLRNVYLPPFKAGLEAGAQTVMTSFNELNGVPASGNRFLLKDVLRDELKFDGFVVSDWNSITEMIPHGYAKDEKHAAEHAANAGLDMEMTSTSYEKNLKELIEEGKFSEAQLNIFVKNILRVKFRLNLFKNPYLSSGHTGNFYSEGHLEKAKTAAVKSTVLLKNNSVLPLKKTTKIAVIGPLADAQREQLGTWTFDAEKEHTVTPLKSFTDHQINFQFAEGLRYSRDTLTDGFSKAIKAAKASDVILFFGGEEAILSGEAHSRADISLPGAQEALLKELAKLNKPIVLVIMAGRPITIPNIIQDVDAVLMAWHPGTMGGPALHDIIFGISEAGGRLPVTWPVTSGQLPLYYNHKNTGRPASKESFIPMAAIPVEAWQSSLGNTSHYLDAGFEPFYPFGYGLSYTNFEYSGLKISKEKISLKEKLEIKVMVSNVGKRDGEEVVQLYVQDIVGSITRPVKELKGFQRVGLLKGEQKEVTFVIAPEDLKFVNNSMEDQVEPGDFNLWVGPNSASGIKASFTIVE